MILFSTPVSNITLAHSTRMIDPSKLPSKELVGCLERLISDWRGVLPEYERLRLQAISISRTPAELRATDVIVLELEQFQHDPEQDLEYLDQGAKWL